MDIDIRIKNQYRIICEKVFTKEDRYIAECLNINLKSNYQAIVDVRSVEYPAFLYFLKSVFPAYAKGIHYKTHRLKLIPQVKQMYQDWKKEWFQSNSVRELMDEYKEVNSNNYTLRAHQLDSMWRSHHRRFTLYAMEMGTGKTLTAASISKLINYERTVVISPNLLKWNWVEDLCDEWGFDKFRFAVLDTRKEMKALFSEQFSMINYEMVGKRMEDLCKRPIHHIIIDECHYIKSTKSARFQNVRELIKRNPKARVSLLSGTPITNRVTDLFAYLKLSGNRLGSNKANFINQFARKRGSKIIGVKNEDRLYGLLSNFMIRILSSECLDLPDIRIKKHVIDLEKFDSEYDQLIEELFEADQEYKSLKAQYVWLRKNEPHKKDEIDQIKQEMFKVKGQRKNNINTLNRITSVSKVPYAIEYIDHLVDMGNKPVIFGSYKQPLHMIKEHYGEGAVLIDGSVPPFERQKMINEFKNDPKVKVFVGQVVAAGIGINLVNSTKCLFLNMPFTPDQVEQPQKRLHRSGQTKDVDVIYLLAKDSIDQNIYGIVANKGNDINKVVNSGKENGIINYDQISEQIINSVVADYKNRNNEKDNS